MTLRRLALTAILAFVTSAAQAAQTVKLGVAVQKRLGVATAPLAAARRKTTVAGFARVVDVGPLALLDSDLSAALAAAAASRAEADRSKLLNAADATVSAKAAQAAVAQARADAARVLLLRRRLGLEWGPTFARLSDAARGRLIADLSAGRTALVRIDAAAPPLGLTMADLDLGAGGAARAVVLGPARTSDPRYQVAGVLARVSGPNALRLPLGLSVPATLSTGAAQTGVILPRSALYRQGGQTTVYIRKDAQTFEQRAVVGGVSDPAGLFAPHGFAPGEDVVVDGAAALAAAATPPEPA